MSQAQPLNLARFPQDRRYLADAFDRLPYRWHPHIAERYNSTFDSKGRQAANLTILDALESVADFRFGVASFDDDLRAFAKARAQECFNEICRYKEADTALEAMRGVALRYGIEPPNRDNVIPRAQRARLLCEKWWRRQVRKTAVRNVEKAAIFSGLVHKRAGLYVSDEALQRRTGQRLRNRAILESTFATNSDGQEFNVQELSDKGTSNPVNRRNELMTRIAGFDLIAQAQKHAAEFYTITAPSKYHARQSGSGKENPKYNGATPKETQGYLCKQWAKIRAALQRANISVYGIRVAEPHHDGTPHWHMLVFAEQKHVKQVRQIMKKYALQEDGDEQGAEKHRFTAEKIDRKKGTAAGYLAKYIAKNIDGYQVGEDWEAADGQNAAIETARRVDAWASTWGIRQFQQFGGAPVTIWREIRRATEAQIAGERLRLICKSARSNDWSAYVMQNGGPFGGDRFVTLAREAKTTEEIDQATGEVITHYVTNAYGEPAAPAIVGFMGEGELVETRLREWVFERRGKAATPRSSINNCTGQKKSSAKAEGRGEEARQENPYCLVDFGAWVELNTGERVKSWEIWQGERAAMGLALQNQARA